MVGDADGIKMKDLELLMQANTQTQQMFGELLHAIELQQNTLQPCVEMMKEVKKIVEDLKNKLFKYGCLIVLASGVLSIIVNLVLNHFMSKTPVP